MVKSAHKRNTVLEASTIVAPPLLLIFGKNFEGHGVTHPNAQANKCAGEGEEGWGYHANGTVDCVDPSKVQSWSGWHDTDSWSNLYNMEVTPSDLSAPNPAQALIRRIVVCVSLAPSPFTRFIPDPAQHAILLTASQAANGAYGVVCLRPMVNEEQAAYRKKLASRRRSMLENCM